MAEILEHVIVKLFGIVEYDFSWDTETPGDDLSKKNFLIVVELMLVTGFASIHLVKYSTATMVKV
jgi:hypothetical protein